MNIVIIILCQLLCVIRANYTKYVEVFVAQTRIKVAQVNIICTSIHTISMNIMCIDLKLAIPVVAAESRLAVTKGRARRRQWGPVEHHQLRSHGETIQIKNHMSMLSCQKGPTRHASAWQIGPFCQDTLDQVSLCVANGCRQYTGKLPVV